MTRGGCGEDGHGGSPKRWAIEEMGYDIVITWDIIIGLMPISWNIVEHSHGGVHFVMGVPQKNPKIILL